MSMEETTPAGKAWTGFIGSTQRALGIELQLTLDSARDDAPDRELGEYKIFSIVGTPLELKVWSSAQFSFYLGKRPVPVWPNDPKDRRLAELYNIACPLPLVRLTQKSLAEAIAYAQSLT